MFSTYQRLGISVWSSDRDVLRAARKRIDKGVLRDPRFRHQRRHFYREMLAHHRRAQQLCIQFKL